MFSFFKKLRSGDFGLFETYWFYGVVVGIIANIVLGFITSDIGFGILGLIYVAYGTQVALGLWGAAKKYKGLKALAILSQIIAVLSWLSLILLVFLALSSLFSGLSGGVVEYVGS